MITIITSIIAIVFLKKKNTRAALRTLVIGLLIDLFIFVAGIFTSIILILTLSGAPQDTQQLLEQNGQCPASVYNSQAEAYENTDCSGVCTYTDYNQQSQKFETYNCSE